MKQMRRRGFQPFRKSMNRPRSRRPMAGGLCGVLLTLFCVSWATQASEPIKFTDLEKGSFLKLRWQNLKEQERAAFYRAYIPAKKMLDRVRLGEIDPKPMQECILGEAPSIAEAEKKFPLHYPMLGRMQSTSGTFEWTDKKLIFRTATQRYHVDEYHILYRLEQLGFTKESKPRKATVDAIWMVNRIDGLRIVFMQTIELAPAQRASNR